VPDELPYTKKIVIVAGPNGAGKTTFAREYLPQEADCPTFINADLIAVGLSPFQPDLATLRAGRLMLEAGLKNFLDVYRHRVDYWLWLDNSTPRAALKEEGHNP
jgi:hypothetical protein